MDSNPYESDLAEDDPDLYGLLLLADQKISNVGTTQVWFWLMFALGLCIGLHMKWFDQATGANFDSFRGIGVYIFVWVTAFSLFVLINGMQERSMYRSMRDEILDALRRSDRSIYQLIADMQHDPSLSNISEQLKDDKRINVKSRASDAVT